MLNKPVKILITGNGFDIAHNLKTGYTDFLKFCDYVKTFFKVHIKSSSPEKIFINALKTWELNSQIKDEFLSAFRNYNDGSKNIFDEINRLTENNLWIDFISAISRSQSKRGINWVDFEAEIRNIIYFADRTERDLTASYENFMKKFCDKNYINTLNLSLGDSEKLSIFDSSLRNSYYSKNWRENPHQHYPLTVNDFRTFIYGELEDLIRALELYLAHFINNAECKPLTLINKIWPDYVLNFNYTNTFERVYRKINSKIIYIHGKCEESEHENNMTLGINEYWQTQDEIMNNVNYAIFRKYVQRIRKRTIYEYITLRNLIKHGGVSGKSFSVHIFGHSLDITDKDILTDFLISPYADVTVYCHNKESEGERIAKMIALTGSEHIIESVNNNRLRFCCKY